MKECVAAHIQELCRKDTEFARKTMHPRKSMVNCFKYITRMAKEYVKQEREKEETFVSKPYTGTTTKTAAKKSNKAEKKQQDKPSNGYEQISLEGMM